MRPIDEPVRQQLAYPSPARLSITSSMSDRIAGAARLATSEGQNNMNIGEAARQSGLQTTAIRYYEQIGLVCATRRSNGYRDYSQANVNQLRFVQQARNLGFDIEDCRILLELYSDPNRASAQVKAIAKDRLASVDKKLAELEAMRLVLSRLVEQCRGDDQPDCPIIESLAGDRSV
ncbi:MAG: Cu(I)-responsive transcriptional regulator [Hyphomicrobiaceae bacterium]